MLILKHNEIICIYIYISNKHNAYSCFFLGVFPFGAPYPGPATTWMREMAVRGPEQLQSLRLCCHYPPNQQHFCCARHMENIVQVHIQLVPPVIQMAVMVVIHPPRWGLRSWGRECLLCQPPPRPVLGLGSGLVLGRGNQGQGPVDGAGFWSINDDGRGALRLADRRPVGSRTLQTASLALRRSQRSANWARNASSSRGLTVWEECWVLMSSLINTE